MTHRSRCNKVLKYYGLVIPKNVDSLEYMKKYEWDGFFIYLIIYNSFAVFKQQEKYHNTSRWKAVIF